MSKVITQYELATAAQSQGRDTYAPYLWKGLQLWLPFLRGSGNPRDWSGKDHTLYPFGSPTWSHRSGVWPNTLMFDGLADYYETSIVLSPILPYTVSFKMRPNLDSSTSQYTAVGIGPHRAMGVDDSTDRLWCIGKTDEYGTIPVTPAEHSVSFVWTVGGVRFYLDGVYDSTNDIEPSDDGKLHIGHREDSPQLFNGRLWDIRFHSRELSLAEIVEIHQQPWSAATPRPTTLHVRYAATAKTPIPLFMGAQ